MPPPKDPTKIKAYCKKMREISTGNKNCVGRVISEETRKKMSESAKNRCTPKWRELHSQKLSGRLLTDEHKTKISIGGKGIPKSTTTRKRMSDSSIGEKNRMWKGGISFEPYCPKFNREFKERVRAFFNYCCLECGTPQNGKKLGVHHVNYNKQTCCDNSTPLFVPLCASCHGKMIINRGKWEQHFTEIINTYYHGKCYLLKDEVVIMATGVG